MLALPDRVEAVDEVLVATRTDTSSVFEISEEYRQLVSGESEADRVVIDQEISRLRRFGFLAQPNCVDRKQPDRSLVLHLVHGCNLACSYCSVKQGTYGTDFQLMSFETARAALDRFTSPAEAHDVCLFGGEPLINWPVLVKIVQYGNGLRDRTIRWRLTTNGTLIDTARARALKELGVETSVSIDGDADQHDRNRRTLNGEGSYQATVRGIGALLEADARAGLHATHDGRGASYRDRYQHLEALGHGRLPVVIAPETGSGSYPPGLGEQGKHWGATLRESWRAGDRRLPGYIAGFVHLVAQGERAPQQDCPAGRRMVNITPSGEIFACHISAARKQYRLGNLKDAELSNPNPLGSARLPAACSQCWINGLCAHGCPIRRSSGFEPTSDECEPYREPIRCAAYFLAKVGLQDVFSLWGLTEATARNLHQAWAIRELIRARNRHIRPLAIFPSARA